ncbi:MAG: hypothetical protein ACYDBX_02330 [Patescibacteria group bacterium]
MTEAETAKQDVVDNMIYNTVRTIALNSTEYAVVINWDIEHIGKIRDAIIAYICDKTNIIGKDIYP